MIFIIFQIFYFMKQKQKNKLIEGGNEEINLYFL